MDSHCISANTLLTILLFYLSATKSCSIMTGQKISHYKPWTTGGKQTASMLKNCNPCLQSNGHIEICVSGYDDCLAFGGQPQVAWIAIIKKSKACLLIQWTNVYTAVTATSLHSVVYVHPVRTSKDWRTICLGYLLNRFEAFVHTW